MSRKFCKVFSLVAVFLLAALAIAQLPGCGGGGGGAAPTGTPQVSLTDKQSDAFANVFITIKEVRVVPTGLENADDSDPRLPVIATFTNPQPIDILTLRFQQQLLGSVVIPAGSYNQVRLILAPNPTGQGTPANYVILKSDLLTKVPLKTPSRIVAMSFCEPRS